MFGGWRETFVSGGIHEETQYNSQRQAQLEVAASNTEKSVRELEFQITRLLLVNQAMWELLRDRIGITDADLERKMQEVDMRDGVQDGRITFGPVRCPSCNRVSNSKQSKCLYCGQLFEKPAIGL